MLVYRVCPYVPEAQLGQPGHPTFISPDQGWGRWDNHDLYRAFYVAATPTGAIGETFASLSRWVPAMLPHPTIAGAERLLVTYRVGEETHPLLNLDDARVLLDRSLRPTDIAIRNRPRTQDIARSIFNERRWSGVSWWSMHRPQWTLHALWQHEATVVSVESLVHHPALRDAALLLAKQLDPTLGP